MTFEGNHPLEKLSASHLRILLISEIQEFIHWLELKLPVEKLTAKRDKIRGMLTVLSAKENVEFEKITGNYFHKLSGQGFTGGFEPGH